MITDAMIEAAWETIHGPIGEDEADTRIIEMPTKAVVKKAIESALAAMWQPIETHRKGEELFLAYEAGHEPDMYECWWNDLMNDWQSDFGSGLDPSHWAPLPNKPEPPK